MIDNNKIKDKLILQLSDSLIYPFILYLCSRVLNKNKLFSMHQKTSKAKQPSTNKQQQRGVSYVDSQVDKLNAKEKMKQNVIDRTNHQGEEHVTIRNDKRITKLLLNLDNLDGQSDQILKRNHLYEEELKTKQKAQEYRKQQLKKVLEMKLHTILTSHASLQTDLEKKQHLLSQTELKNKQTENEVKLLRTLKNKLISSLKEKSLAELSEKKAILKKIKTEIAKLKEQIKEARRKRKDLEDLSFELQDIILKKKLILKELNDKDLDSNRQKAQKQQDTQNLQAEYDDLQEQNAQMKPNKELLEKINQDLQDKLKKLLDLKGKLKEEAELSGLDMDSIKGKVNALLKEIDLLKDDQDKFSKDIDRLKIQLDSEIARTANLNLNIDSRSKVQKVELKGRGLYLLLFELDLILYKYLKICRHRQDMIKQFCLDSHSGDEGLDKEITGIIDEILKLIKVKDNIKGNLDEVLKGLVSQGNTPEQLKQSQDQLQNIDSQVTNLNKDIDKIKVQVEKNGVNYQTFLDKVLSSLTDKIKHYLSQNPDLIEKIKAKKQQISSDVAKKDDILLSIEDIEPEMMDPMTNLKGKISQVKQKMRDVTNFLMLEGRKLGRYTNQQKSLKKDCPSTYLQLSVDAKNQYDRLKQLQDEQLASDLPRLLGDIDNALDDLNKLKEENKLKKQKDMLSGMINLLGNNDSKVDDLNDKINELQDQFNGLNSDQQDQLRNQLQGEIVTLQEECSFRKNKNDKMKRDLSTMQTMPDRDLLKANNLGQMQSDFTGLDSNELHPIDNALSDLQDKIKQAKLLQKNESKRLFLEGIEKNKNDLDSLCKLVEQLEHDIQKVEPEAEDIDRAYKYKDLERDNDLRTKVKDRLRAPKSKLPALKDQIRHLKKNIDNLENKYLNLDESVPDDIRLEQLDKLQKESEEVVKKIADETVIAKDALLDVHGIAQNVAELKDKYKAKDRLFRACLDSQKQKQGKIDLLGKNQNVFQKKLNGIEDQINQIQLPPETDSYTLGSLDEKKAKFKKLKDKLQDQVKKKNAIQQRINELCDNLKHLPDKEVKTAELQLIYDELQKLDVQLNDLDDDLQDTQQDLQGQVDDLAQFLEKSKEKQLDDTDKIWENLHGKLEDLDQLYNDVEQKHQKYNRKIKDGMRTFSNEEEIVEELRDLKGQSDEIEKELKKIDAKRKNLIAREKQFKDILNKLRKNKKPPTNEEIAQLADKFKNLGGECGDIKDDLTKTGKDLDERIAYLDKFVKRGAELKDLYKDFNHLSSDLFKGFDNFEGKLSDLVELHALLKKVVSEMELGLERDYAGKGEFILAKQKDLEELDDVIEDLDKDKDDLQEDLKNLKSYEIPSIINCDVRDLQDEIAKYQDLLLKLQGYEKTLDFYFNIVIQIKKEIGYADCPANIKIRGNELNYFSQQLKHFEKNLDDLKRVNGPNYSVQNDIRTMEKQVKEYREDKAKYAKVLSKDLQMYEQTPSKLENLETLIEVIQKIRELGDLMLKSLHHLDEDLDEANKVKKEINSKNQLTKWKNLEDKEEELRERLNELKRRFKLIHKGGHDCDGYTSNSEETGFIMSVVNEQPGIENKEDVLRKKIDDIQDLIINVKKQLENNEDKEDPKEAKRIAQLMEEIDDQTGVAFSGVVFLERTADTLDDKFYAMDAQRKLDKRQVEINEIGQVATQFQTRLQPIEEQIQKDLEQITYQVEFMDQHENNTRDKGRNQEELRKVQDELKGYLEVIDSINADYDTLEQKRKDIQEFYDQKVIKESPFRKLKHLRKIDVWILLELNTALKKMIQDLITIIKTMQMKIRDTKAKFMQLRPSYAHLLSDKIYKAIKGDLVDEEVADYMNKLRYNLPIKRHGNNEYTIGNRKITAQLINEKLMVRVGGGYVTMDEFMTVYGPNELVRLQREEFLKSTKEFDFIKTDVLSQYFIGDFLHEDFNQYEDSTMEIQELKLRLKEDQKRLIIHRDLDIDERMYSGIKNQVVGVADARNALKKNIKTIVTHDSKSRFETHRHSGSNSKMSTMSKGTRNGIYQEVNASMYSTNSKKNTDRNAGTTTTSKSFHHKNPSHSSFKKI